MGCERVFTVILTLIGPWNTRSKTCCQGVTYGIDNRESLVPIAELNTV